MNGTMEEVPHNAVTPNNLGQQQLQDDGPDLRKADLIDQFQKVAKKVMSTEGPLEGRRKPRCRGTRIDAKLLMEVDDIICKMMGKSDSFLKLNQLVYTGAVVVERGSEETLTPA